MLKTTKGTAGVKLPGDSQKRSQEDRVHPGDTIRRERHRQHMSMRELARRVGVTPSHLSKIERGLANPSVGTLWTVSDELGVPVSTMFAEAEEAAGGAAAPSWSGSADALGSTCRIRHRGLRSGRRSTP